MKKKTEKKIKKLENKAEKKNKRHFFKKKKSKTDQIIRIEELEALMEQEGGDVDPEKIVSIDLTGNGGRSERHCFDWIN